MKFDFVENVQVCFDDGQEAGIIVKQENGYEFINKHHEAFTKKELLQIIEKMNKLEELNKELFF